MIDEQIQILLKQHKWHDLANLILTKDLNRETTLHIIGCLCGRVAQQDYQLKKYIKTLDKMKLTMEEYLRENN